LRATPDAAYRGDLMSGALATWFSRFPEGWWGYHWTPPAPMSAIELMGTPTFDSRLMATLWAVVSRRRSVMLSSEAPQAGKTTALSALVDFLPDDTTGIFVRGWWEEYDWLDEIEPGTGYLLINEMSDHLPIYVWGRAARGALMLAGKGWGMGATMHADSLPEAVEALQSQLGATDADLAGMTLYLQYSAYLTPAGMYRRVEEAWHLRLDETGRLAPVRLAALAGDRSPRLTGAQRLPAPPMLADDGGRGTRSLVHDPGAYAVLAGSLGIEPDTLEDELAQRAAFLEALAAHGICDPPSVAIAVRGYPDLPDATAEEPDA
jgi:hypothetical protein